MNNFLYYFLPIPTIVNLILLLVWVYKCRAEASSLFKEAGKGALVSVAIVFCFSLLASFLLVVPKHLLYNDEFYYMLAAKNLFLHANFGLYFKSFGWPVILAGMFAVFGINNYVAIITSIFFSALTVLNIFLLIYLIYKDKYLAILCAIVFSLMPYQIFWGATAETSAASIFFITFCIFVMLLYFEKQTRNLLWLSLLGISFASQIRSENYILFGLFLAGFYIFLKRRPDFKDVIWFISAGLCLPNLIQIFRFYHQIDSNPANSVQLLYPNMIWWLSKLFDSSLYPLLFILLFSLGFIYLWYRKTAYSFFTVLCFMALFPIYSYCTIRWIVEPASFVDKTRFYVFLFPFLIIWFAGGVSFFLEKAKKVGGRNAILLAVAAALLISYLPYLRMPRVQSNGSHILETEILGTIETKLPKGCIVVANYPEVLQSATNIKTIDINEFIGNPSFRGQLLSSNSCLLFFEDYFCVSDKKSYSNCNLAKRLFNLKPVESYSLDYGGVVSKYTFYKICGQKTAR